MKNKFLSILLAICFIIPFSVSLTACGGGGPSSPQPEIFGAMNETEWKETINTNEFKVMHSYQLMYSVPNLKHYALHYSQGDYKIYDETLSPSEYNGNTKFYYKSNDNGNVKYELVADKYINGYQWVTQTIDATEYESNLSDVLAIINYVQNNRSKFTAHNADLGDYIDVSYNLTAIDSEIAPNINNLKTQMRLTEYNIDNINVTQTRICLKQGDIDIIWIAYSEVEFFSYNFEKMFEGLTNYTITGGPSETHVDYVEMKIADNGMYFSNPNANNDFATNYYKEFYTRDNGDGTYSRLIPTEAGGWQEQNVSETAYNTNLQDTISLYLVDLSNKYSRFYWQDGKVVFLRYANYADNGWITVQRGRFVYTYSNFEITINDNYEIASISWQMQLHDNLYNEDLDIYYLTLTPQNTPIQYPSSVK